MTDPIIPSGLKIIQLGYGASRKITYGLTTRFGYIVLALDVEELEKVGITPDKLS